MSDDELWQPPPPVVMAPFRPPVIVVDAWRAAPPDTFEQIMAWVRAQAEHRGRQTLAVTLVTDDGAWTETHIQQPVKVLRKRRRR